MSLDRPAAVSCMTEGSAQERAGTTQLQCRIRCSGAFQGAQIKLAARELWRVGLARQTYEGPDMAKTMV